MKGRFLKMYEDYRGVLEEKQAENILIRVAQEYKDTNKQVALIYSANRVQAKKIRVAYAEGKWETETGGGNQGKVIGEIEKLLKNKYAHLQNIFRIFPITTCAKSGGVGKVKKKWLKEDLKEIGKFLKKGNVVLGWQNSDSLNKEKSPHGPYAIGGSISKQLRDDQNLFIQTELIKFEEKYRGPHVENRTEAKINQDENKDYSKAREQLINLANHSLSKLSSKGEKEAALNAIIQQLNVAAMLDKKQILTAFKNLLGVALQREKDGFFHPLSTTSSGNAIKEKINTPTYTDLKSLVLEDNHSDPTHKIKYRDLRGYVTSQYTTKNTFFHSSGAHKAEYYNQAKSVFISKPMR